MPIQAHFDKQRELLAYGVKVLSLFFIDRVASYRDDEGIVRRLFEEADKKNDEKEAEKRAYELIMQRKEKLLSFEEPVSFIFAHSAIREGWDNPNVFQICALREITSEKERRQTIGRGLRLPVTQEGLRVTDRRLNVLTVVANDNDTIFRIRMDSTSGDRSDKGIHRRHGWLVEGRR